MAGNGAKAAAATGALLGILSMAHPAHGAAGAGGGGGRAGGGTVSANVALGQRMAAKHGWTGPQWSCLHTLWQGESGWSQYADTRRSGLDPADAAVFAYGIPQSRPATKMPRAAWPSDLGGRSKAGPQIGWGLGYIAATYGTPCAALGFKRSHGNQGY
jgi:hypothetical protein